MKSFKKLSKLNQKTYFIADIAANHDGSLSRAKKLIRSTKPVTLIVSILNHGDLIRDQMIFFSGFPSPSVIKKNGKVVLERPPEPNIMGSKYFKGKYNKTNKFLDYLHANSRLLKRFNGAYYGKYSKSMTKYNKNAASISEIINYAVDITNSLNINVIYMIQYPDYVKDFQLKGRKILLREFNRRNVQYIDTWDYLHGNKKEFVDYSKVWRVHHTPFGNEIVCQSVLDSEIFK